MKPEAWNSAAWAGHPRSVQLDQLWYLASTLEFGSLGLNGSSPARPVRLEPWPSAQLGFLV